MNKTQSTANHVKNETFTRLLPRAFQTKIILGILSVRNSLSLVRARTLALSLRSFQSLRSSQISSSSQYLRETGLSDT